MAGFTCEAIKSVVGQLMSSCALKDIIYVAGGIVPYLCTAEDSGRMHSDIDIVAANADMPIIRQYLQSTGLYQSDYDSLEFGYNTGRVDYGIEAFIQGIPVSFAPFDVQGSVIIQRNFSKLELAGFDALMTVTMRGIAIEDYITSHEIEGMRIGTYTLEMVKCTKETTGRDKDIRDIQEIENYGIDQERYLRIKPAIQAMTLDALTPDEVQSSPIER